CTIADCAAAGRSVIAKLPEVAGTMRMPAGPWRTVSASVTSPLTTCARLYCGWSPNSTSTFARLRSASSSITSLRRCPKATARLAATLVLPTPPLPLETATTRTGSRRSARRTSAPCVGLRMGGAHLAVLLGHRAFVDARRDRVQAFDRAVDQPQAAAVGRVQVVRYALAVRKPGRGQLVPDQRADDAAELGGLVDLGHDRACQRQGAEPADGLVEARLLARGRHREIEAD